MVLRSAIPVAEGHCREHQRTGQEMAFERGRSTVSQRPRITEICSRLNATPRKCLGYKTPAEVFRQKLLAQIRRTG